MEISIAVQFYKDRMWHLPHVTITDLGMSSSMYVLVVCSMVESTAFDRNAGQWGLSRICCSHGRFLGVVLKSGQLWNYLQNVWRLVSDGIWLQQLGEECCTLVKSLSWISEHGDNSEVRLNVAQ